MRTHLRFLPVLILLACVACPLRPGERATFTNADLGGARGFDDWLGAAPGEATDDAEGEPVTGNTREIVEPDVVRRDGPTLFVLNQYRGLILVNLDDEAVLSRVPVRGYPRDLYVRGARAYVLVAMADSYVAVDTVANAPRGTRLYVVDIADRGAPAILGQFDLEGDLVESRLIGDTLYAVTTAFTGWAAEPDGPVGGGVSVGMDVASRLKASTGTSWVTSVDVSDPANAHQVDQQTFDGQGTVIHATDSAIFVAAPDWQASRTDITYIDIDDLSGLLTVRGSTAVTGYVADRFKLDAYEGVLRVVSSQWNGGAKVYVTTVALANPDALTVLAEKELESAQGDSLFATRFDGDRAYVVTYFQVDPLYVLDLSDPLDPKIAGELEVPGWSTHIEPMGDRLLALGVDDTAGRRVSLSLFNVADPAAPALLERVSFGQDWSWSTAYGDVKSFALFDGLAVVPFSGWTDSGGFERLQFVSYTNDDLQVRGHIDVTGAALRTLAYGDAYYTLTPEELDTIDAADLDNPVVTNRLVLAENIVDYVELAPSLGAEIVAKVDGKTEVKLVDETGQALGRTSLEAGQIVETLRRGNSVVVVGTNWSYGVYDDLWGGSGQYRVAVVDCTDPAHPVAAPVLEVDVQPYFGYFPVYYGGGSSVGMPETDVAPWWRPWVPQDLVLDLGDRLALRGTAGTYDHSVGDDSPDQGLAVITLEPLAWESTLGLGYDDLVSVDAAGPNVIVGTCEDAGGSAFRPLCAYYTTLVDVQAATAGPLANVPGYVVQYDPGTDVLTVKDDQWDGFSGIESRLQTVRWDGGDTAEPLDELALPDGTVQVLGRGTRVFYDAYDDAGYRLHSATVSTDGSLDSSAAVAVTAGWANLLDAQGNDAFVTVGSGSVERYRFTGANGALAAQVDVMAPPTRIRFGQSQAYLILGYSGTEPMPLP